MRESEMRFLDQVVIVTGGAQGIGRACVDACASEGAGVVVADIDAAEEPKPLTVGNKPLRPPFLRGDDSGGFGPNASSRDDFDIPTVLRRQMD